MTRRAALLAAAVIFAIEIAIALFVRGGIVRHTIGDALAAMLVAFVLYACAMRAPQAAFASFGIAALIETAQAAGIAEALGLEGAARIAFGATFDWRDLLAYAAGAGTFFLIARRAGRRGAPSPSAAPR